MVSAISPPGAPSYGPPQGAEMSDQFDELSRAMAGSTSRRGALKLLGAAAIAGATAVIFKPFGAGAVTCAADVTPCGTGCCPATKQTCSDPATQCCCPSGTTPCGPRCCNKGIACQDATRG